MVGDVVGGYEVKEFVGSGKSGLLYLAVHASGHRAVVRRRLGDDDLHEFAQESAQSLGLKDLPSVERRKSRAGVPVLIAIIDSGAPGSGYTDHTNTMPLPPPEAATSRASSWKLPAVIVGFALVGAISAAVVVTERGRPSANEIPLPVANPVAVVADQHGLPVAAALPVVVAGTPQDTPDAEPSLDAGQAVDRNPAAPKLRGSALSSDSTCTPTDQWKRDRYADIRDLFHLAGATEDLSSSWEKPLTELEREVSAARSGKECSTVEKTVRRYALKLGVAP